MSASKDEQKMDVTINQATRSVWKGEATSISSQNSDGPFDILPMHANFITLIEKQSIKVCDVKGEEKTYNFDLSVIYVHSNKVKIYADFV